MTVGVTHHVSLNGVEYLVKPGSYRKRNAPIFGARFAGGDSEYNNLSFWQHWAQKCFVGGADAPLFADDAMYDDGVGLDTTLHESVRLSRDLSKGTGSNWGVSAGSAAAGAGLRFFQYGGKLYVLTLPGAGVEGKLWEYNASTDGWAEKTSLNAQNMTTKCAAVFDGKVFIGGVHKTTGKPMVIFDNGNLGSWSSLTLPDSVKDTTSGKYTVTAMRAFQQKLYIAFGPHIWRYKDDQTIDGNTVFYKANAAADSNGIVAMEVHLGFLYMLSSNGHIHRTDANSTFDIWNWDSNTQGVALKSFDGRLFVLTFEFTNTTDAGWGVLYQMSGSAVTQLKRWGKDDRATRIGSMTVYNRRMWYGASNLLGMGSGYGFGVACYDPIEDAHSIYASNSNEAVYGKGASPYLNYIVDDVSFYRGKMFALVRGHGAFYTPYMKNDIVQGFSRYDITRAGGILAAGNGGWMTTSTYDAGTPGVNKLWRKVTLDVALPSAATSIGVDYSTDDGTSWTSLDWTSGALTRQKVDLFLNVKSTSLKLKITLRSTDSSRTPHFFGFVVSYMTMPDPNWMWQMTLVVSSPQRLLNNTSATIDTTAALGALEDAFRARALVTFIDRDGTVWADNGPGVLIYEFSESIPHMDGSALEGEVSLSLLEAVESY